MNTKRRGLVGSWYTCSICGEARPARKFSEIAPKACVCKRCKEVENDLPKCYTKASGLRYLLRVCKELKA